MYSVEIRPFQYRLNTMIKLPSFSKRNVNLLLRAFSLLVRLIFFLFVASHLSDKEFGYFGIIFSFIGYATILMGFEFHTYSNREILSSDEEKTKSIFIKSFSLYALSLPLGIVFIFVFYFLGYFETGNLILLMLILFSEYFSVQVSRLLIILEEQIASTTLLFMRSALWCIVYIGFAFYGVITVAIDSILLFWLLGSFFSLVIGFIILSLKGYTYNKLDIDFSFLKTGVKTSAVMFLTATTYQGFFIFDRLILQKNLAEDIFASYILFSSLFMTVVTLADAGFVAFFMPRLIKLFTDDVTRFEKTVRSFMKSLQAFSLMFTIALTVLVIGYMYATNDMGHDKILVVACCATNAFAFALSIAPHTCLYAMRNEVISLRIQAIGLGVHLIGIAVMSYYFEFWAALIFPTIVFGFIYWFKKRALFLEMDKAVRN